MIDALQRLPGLDVGPWLDGGRAARKSYIGLLARFAGSHAHDAATIRERLAAGQTPKASRTARTLQRVAAGLGLADVERSATELEAAIDAGGTPDALALQLDDLERDLGELVSGLSAAGIEPERALEPIAS